MNSDCTVVILAGGNGVRMGRLGHLVAKAALNAYDQPILIRLLSQILTAGFLRTLISTDAGHYQQLRALITDYGVNSKAGERTIEVFSNPAHEKGPVEALSVAIDHLGHSRCMMCLGDIFFRYNSFVPFAAELNTKNDYLGVADPLVPADLAQGGLVYHRGGEVEAVVECPGSPRKNAKRWSGLALFGQGLREDLALFLSQFPAGSRMGEFLDFRRKRGRSLRVVVGSDFVNINSREDLLLATLYAATESYENRVELSDCLQETALRLREAVSKTGRLNVHVELCRGIQIPEIQIRRNTKEFG